MNDFIRLKDLSEEYLNKLVEMKSIIYARMGRTTYNVNNERLTDFYYTIKIQDGTIFKIIFEGIPSAEYSHFYEAPRSINSFVEVKKFLLKQRLKFLRKNDILLKKI